MVKAGHYEKTDYLYAFMFVFHADFLFYPGEKGYDSKQQYTP